MGMCMNFMIIFFILPGTESVYKRNTQRQVDDLEQRYEQDYVSVKQNLRDLWASIAQVETECKVTEQTTVAASVAKSAVQNETTSSWFVVVTQLIRGFSEEKEFLRESLDDLKDAVTQLHTNAINTTEENKSQMHEIHARCISTEKEVEHLREKQDMLMEKIERTNEKVEAEVEDLRLNINRAVEEVRQNSILNRPSSCVDMVKAGVTSSGVYTLYQGAQPFLVYCLIKDGGGYTFISPESYINVDISRLYNDRSHVLIRHRRTNGFQYESRIEQISRYRTRPLSVQYNSHTGYTSVVNRHMTPYIYVGLNPKKLEGRSHRGDRQGYKSNGKDFSFINCDGNPNGYFAFLFNHNKVSPSGKGESPAISRKWIESSTRVTLDILPDKFLCFFELHFGGCGAYVGANHIRDVSGAAVGMPYTL